MNETTRLAARERAAVIETERLVLRRLAPDDAAFILELVNDPDWLRYIGDKGVRNLDDARAYIQNGPMAMYERVGFGLFLVELKSDGAPIGLCGLIKRETLEDVDLGFAYLPAHRANGYGREAARATLIYGRDVAALQRIVAITSIDNEASGRLLQAVGMRFERLFDIPGEDRQVKLFALGVDARLA